MYGSLGTVLMDMSAMETAIRQSAGGRGENVHCPWGSGRLHMSVNIASFLLQYERLRSLEAENSGREKRALQDEI